MEQLKLFFQLYIRPSAAMSDLMDRGWHSRSKRSDRHRRRDGRRQASEELRPERERSVDVGGCIDIEEEMLRAVEMRILGRRDVPYL